ncbi:MAG: hydrogenase 4 subunit B [Nitrospiraceae bacterium]|nr:hydrogenase 4 subunit B [Nitrospiraceae bacterium]
MDPESFLYIAVSFFILGAVASLLPLKKVKDYIYLLPVSGSVIFGILSFSLVSGSNLNVFSFPISSIFEFKFHGDSFSGFFAILISVLAFCVSIFSIGYTSSFTNKGLFGFLYNMFILSMYAVIFSANIITFLISWETMSVLSYFLVTFERDEKSSKAGLLYIVMTHIGTAFIIILFLLLYGQTGSMDFAEIKKLSSQIPENLRHLIFIFSIIGFGTKAGIIPLHTWLPKAHPAAPSNISSLMSGVMIKTGIYGFIRISIDMLGSGPEWWGVTIIIIGTISSVLGVLYALIVNDIKKLLAYSSIENIGIILLGVGASMVFNANGLYLLSGIALIAGLYHALNHSIFKGLLFMSAGSVVHAAHTKNMENMGGLLKAMPYTGLFFLIGSVSICALPPFNGFVSEWLTYQSLLLGFQADSVLAKIITPLGGAALALTGAIAAACFVKAFGISFLGMPRSRQAENAVESTPSMTAGMAVLAVLCFLSGIFPGTVINMLSSVIGSLSGYNTNNDLLSYLHADNFFIFISDSSKEIGNAITSLSPVSIILTMIVMLIALLVFIRIVNRGRKITYADSWDCGIPSLTPRMQYTSTAFTKPIKIIFKRIYLPKREINISYLVKPLFVKAMKYSGGITPFIDKYIYDNVTGFIKRIANKVRLMQSGSLHLYLGYILITLIILLIFGD